MYANILTVGELAAASAGAQALVDALRSREAALRGRRAPQPAPRTLLLEWTDPPMSGGHWTPDLVELAGGEPILAHPGANSQRLEWETVAAADPDVIIIAPCGYDLAQARAAAGDAAAGGGLPRCGRCARADAFVMDGNAYVNRPGPRLLDTAEIIAAALGGIPAPAQAIETLQLFLTSVSAFLFSGLVEALHRVQDDPPRFGGVGPGPCVLVFLPSSIL